MRRIPGHPRAVLIPLVASLLLSGACGGGSNKASSNDSSNTTVASGDSTDASTTTAKSASSGSGGAPKLADGTYTQGTAHLEMSGGSGGTLEMQGGGQTSSGATLLTFADSGGTGNLVIGFGGGSDNVDTISALVSGVSAGGNIGQECTIKFSKNDSSEVAADFTCKDAPAVDSKAGRLSKRDLKGSFSVKR